MVASRLTGRGVVLLVTVSCVLGLALAPGVLAQAGENPDESSVGAQVSSFMQSTAADANGTVDNGMWTAGVNGTEAPGQAVSKRAGKLLDRLEALENRSAALAADRSNMSGVAYTARASAVHAQLANVRAAVNETMTVARTNGVNDTKLAELRQAAGNATGPEIASIARNITNAGQGPPPWAGGGDGPGGPPGDAPGQGNDTDGGPPDTPPGNGSGNAPDGGPPDDASGDGSGNAPEGGPPDDSSGGGSGNAPEGEGGPSDDSSGTGTGGSGGTGGSSGGGPPN